ncbi:MAG: 3'(2'),5'-bisphosphate nucleotidase CysQ, partial [Gluconacetobacter diazotrophicus]|nr:3'(2'),5'-bisphosphate nucleotidase CysQ [Gluconacetobacter diazotrophicus]
PALGRLFVTDPDGAETARLEPPTLAIPDEAAFRPIRVSAPLPPGRPVRVVASRSHRTDATDALIRRFGADAALCPSGSSLKFCLIAAGEADVYPRIGPTMEWDTAAAHAVLRAAGGRLETLDGTPLRYGKRGRPGEPDFLNPSFFATAALSLPPDPERQP